MKILTFDIEEWFHLLDNKSTKSEKEWSNYECRIHKNVDFILDFLDNNNINATFFVLGWIADKYPEIVKKIDGLGHEIGSHSHMHQLFYNQNENFVKEDLKKSINVIQDITGKKVYSFRAPGFSITENNKWVFEILHSLGITHDCSIFPAQRAHGGFPSYNYSKPSLLHYNNIVLKEFPINTVKFFFKNFIFSGGGYFRILPYSKLKSFTKSSEYVMTYFHPRDFDPDQPVIKDLSYFKKFKSYVGLNSSKAKLQNWVNDFDFVDLRTADKSINWNNAKSIYL